MQNQIGCICFSSLHFRFSNVPSSYIRKRKHTHISCTCLAFLYCVLLNVSLKELLHKIQNGIGFIYLISFHCVFSICKLLEWEDACLHILHLFNFSLWTISSNCLPKCMFDHTGDIGLTSFHCVFSNEFKNCPNEKIWNYTGCICLTLLKTLESRVSFQMSPETVSPRGCIITILAFVLLFFHCVFSNESVNFSNKRTWNYIDCTGMTLLQYVFQNVSSNHLYARTYTHIGFICVFDAFFGFFQRDCCMYRNANYFLVFGPLSLSILHCALYGGLLRLKQFFF